MSIRLRQVCRERLRGRRCGGSIGVVAVLSGLVVQQVSCMLETHGEMAAAQGNSGYDASAGGTMPGSDAAADAAGKMDASVDSSQGGDAGGGGASGQGAGAGGSAAQGGSAGTGGMGGAGGSAGQAGIAGSGGAVGGSAGASAGGAAGTSGAGGSAGGLQPVDAKIDANNRDGWDDGSNASLDTCYFGTLSWSDVGGYQWTLALEHGTVIHDAYVSLYSYGPGSSHVAYDAEIRVEDVDDAAPFTSAPDNIYNRGWWSTSVAWSIPQAGLPANQWSNTPSIKALVQHVLDRPGWSAGHHLSISIRGKTGNTGCSEHIADFHEDSTKAAVLHVE
jgi:hypothetical protein